MQSINSRMLSCVFLGVRNTTTRHIMSELTGAQTSLVFNVTRKEAELVRPAETTPYEVLDLSDLDVHDMQFSQQNPVILFYKSANNDNNKGTQHDPVKVIKEALRKVLVSYYPFAGRVREVAGPRRKLVVECTGEGILFVEADADVSLEEFGEPLYPPFPCIGELLHNPVGSSPEILDTPLLLIQVTRLKCGGFVFAIRFNHLIVDAQGLVQLLTAIGEMARGAESPSVQSVWMRHLLKARDPPRVTCVHPEYDETPDSRRANIVNVNDICMVNKCFFFGPKEIAALGRFVPMYLKSSSKFEIITAFLWRARTKSLNLNPEEEVRLRFIVNARSKAEPPLPVGYYGNVLVSAVAISTAGELSNNPIEYAITLLKEAKAKVTSEYINSVVDLLVTRDTTWCEVARTFLVSDASRAGLTTIDLGLGVPVYGGIARDNIGPVPGLGCYYIACDNFKGQSGTMVPLCLPMPSMEKFVKEFNHLLIAPRQRWQSGGTGKFRAGFNYEVGSLFGRVAFKSGHIGTYQVRLLSGFVGPISNLIKVASRS